MAENTFLRSAVLIIFASWASLSAEAWLRAGENPGEATPKSAAAAHDFAPLPETADEIALPDDTIGEFTADLQDRLEKDLKARRPIEFEFIAKVIELVEADTLPLALVNRCYLWARRQSAYPFQHFQRAVELQARRIGVDI